MWRVVLSASVLVFALVGCAAPEAHKLPPPPAPVLSTRPPTVVAPLPKPEPPSPPAAAAPRTGHSLRGARVVVDAGHGGHDPGARGRSSLPEKTITLDIAQHLASRLRDQGAAVTMTRNSDRFIELDERAAIADRTHADFFVAIHADSSRKSGVQGMTIYMARNASADSRRAAKTIAAALERAGLEVRGVNTAGYRVLVGHSRPGVLIECGFLTNQSEAQRLNDSSYRARVADAIADGIADHLSR
jgi:N-acetylmuramoyl-L-alanine amidase